MTLRRGAVFYHGLSPQKVLAGHIEEHEDQYLFRYDQSYLAEPKAQPVSLTLPLGETEFSSIRLFSFFDGLIPEGWLLETAAENWKLNPRDRMGLLLACCRETIGAVTVEPAGQ
jgi:serine/threonine-protein kinase HipA